MKEATALSGFQLFNYLNFRKDPLNFLYNTREISEIVAINPKDKQTSYVIHSLDAVKEILTTKEEYFVKGRSSEIFKKTLGDGILTSEGKSHQRQRKIMQPAFHKKLIEQYAEDVVTITESYIQEWKPGEVRDISDDMLHLTLRIIFKTMFDINIKDNQAKEIKEAVNAVIEKTAQSLFLPFSIPDSLPTLRNRQYKKAMDVLYKAVDEIIEISKKQEEDSNLLKMMMESRDMEKNVLSKGEVRDNIITMLIAGHETTATALSWIWYLLAKHPTVEQKFSDEALKIIQKNKPKFEHISQLSYTNQVVQEALRLYPPAWVIMRQAIADVTINGYSFEKGSIFLISPYAIHRNERFYDEPNNFVPERFSKDERSSIANYAYIPFGAGSRGCIGSQFATMEAVLIMVTIAKNYQLKLERDSLNVIPEPLVSLRIKNRLSMIVSEK